MNSINHFLDNPWLIVAAVLVAVFGVGRLSRILTWDAFPPSVAIRQWWRRVAHRDWVKLVECFWCATPWIMLGAIGWFTVGLWVEWIAIAWWIFWGWLALSYVASIIIARDEPSQD